MGLPERAEVAVGGPHGSTWGDEGDSFTLQNHATITVSTTTPGAFPAQTITFPNKQMWAGQPQPDAVAQGDAIQSISGVQISNGPTAQAAFANLNFFFQVARNIGLAVPIVGGVQITQLTVPQLLSPIPSGASIIFTNVAGNSFTAVTSALVAAGSTVIPITANTPANSYAVGTAGAVNGTIGMLIVGGLGPVTQANPVVPTNAAFGWLAAGGGTPAWPAGASIVTPALATNIALVTPPNTGLSYLPVAPSDNFQVYLITASTTAVVQILNCQPLLV